MRLLILTQAIDLDNPVLGFFHSWVGALAKECESVEVVCLKEGRHSLQANVGVHSLGKEKGTTRLTRILRFYRYIFSLRYDAVFVHMNQEYVLLGALPWRLTGRRVYMWRNHYAGSFLTSLAVILCHKTFCTSKSSYIAAFAKNRLMPVGVDTDVFRPLQGIERVPRSILSLGRIAPSKKLHILIDALRLLSKDAGFTCDIYGSALPEHSAYENELKKKVEDYGLQDKVRFLGSVRNSDTPAIYSAHQLFVNMSAGGMYDKTIIEAAASGCTVLAVSPDFRETFGEQYSLPAENVEAIGQKVRSALTASDTEARRFRQYAESHSLSTLAARLVSEMHV